MEQAILKTTGSINHTVFPGNDIPLHCSQIWDPIHARFEQCTLPYITAIPAIIGICIFIGLALKLLPIRFRRPIWARNIIDESSDLLDELARPHPKSFSTPVTRLLILSAIGFVLQTFLIFHPDFPTWAVVPAAASWGAGLVAVAIWRPQTTPRALLVFYVSIFISQTILLSDTVDEFRQADVPTLLSIISAFGAICVIANVPLRDQRLPRHMIGHSSGGFPSALLRSPEDNLTLWQFMSVSWMAPLIKLGNVKQLNDDEVWDLGYEFKHGPLTEKFRELEGSVLVRLLKANGIDLMIMGVLAITELFANFSAPIFLQKILQSMDNVEGSKRAALTYAVLSLTVRMIAAQVAVFGLWYGRRCYERSRGELITMLYEKTLSRKVVSISAKARETNGSSNGHVKSEKTSTWRKALHYVFYPFTACLGRSKSKKEDEDNLATMGKILNLMRFDAYEVAQRFWEFSSIVTQPLAVVFSVVLIWRLIGWPCLIGVVTVFFAQAVNAVLARILLRWERERRISTDKKLHKISQLVESIRHLRWYGWQDVWLERVMESRKHELRLRVITGIWRSLISFVNVFSSGMFPVAAFYAYTMIAGLPLRVDIAFPALQLFAILESSLNNIPNLITVLLNAKVSVGRIEEFMNEPNKLEAETVPGAATQLELRNASFAWPGACDPVLRDITISFTPGLTVIFGEVGTGKTALLQALLGEADLLSGDYHRSNEMVGYCAQTPWLQSMSIRDNILFSSPYDPARYRQVLEACALIPDMANFKHGDLSLVGENGVGLSGGQKARLSLARAVYSFSKILFLDDPLSALDHQTAETIVRRCIKGPLLEGRTTILVTHRTELCIRLAQQVVEIKDGSAHVIDITSLPSDHLTRVRSSDSLNGQAKNDSADDGAIPDKFMEEEHRAHGGVMASVYWEYIKAGKLKWWTFLIIALALSRVVYIGETWFLKQWGEAYGRTVDLLATNPFRNLPSPESNVRPWLIGFFLIAFAQSLAFLISQAFTMVVIYKAGKSLFERVMIKCSHATFRFYDVTPVGRLMNRLTSDISTVDGNISAQFQSVAMFSIIWISSIVVIASVTPVFLIFAVILTIGFTVTFAHFLPTSQSLRRLEMVSLTPLISNFGALADGLTTVRAFCAQYRFQERVIAVTDDFQKMDHFYWSLQAWLMIRFDALSASSTFMLTALALYTEVSPGLTAFLLAAASQFVMATHGMCRTYGQLQMDFVSVERIVELLHLEQEAPGSVEPPASWPLLGGDIVFENVTIAYAPHLDPALSNVSLTIKGGSTTALIGRTGSGKSTLALALLGTTLPTSGRILIDGVDISTVNLQALRSRITFLAQEPVLFPGTMRTNLDPLEEFTSEDCSRVLSAIAGQHNWSLETHIDTGGKNLSQGQRQLVGLARAMLRRSSIIIMDEATASIDMETAGRIQEILREEMRGSTVITIAHRVEAVRNADFCVELGKGKLLEIGEPGKMVAHMQQ